MRYILALLPPDSKVTTYVKAATLLFSPLSDQYLLSTHAHPHVTLAHFECASTQDAIAIWEKLTTTFYEPIPVRFTGFGFVKGLDIHEGFYWAELTVARDPKIMGIHNAAIELIQEHSYPILTGHLDLYHPHLTLARIKQNDPSITWPAHLLTQTEPYTIALGVGDENGQFLYTLRETKATFTK